MFSLKLRLISTTFHNCQRQLSYVERARLLEKIKTDDTFCSSQLESAKFLLYNKGQPLLRKGSGPGDHQASWVDFEKTLELNPDVKTKSVALSVDDAGVARFATMLGSEADPVDVEISNSSKFTDLRVGLFLVNSEVAHTLSKGWSLLMWDRKNQFC
jgi:NADH pyrophosphatase NudC (nudix superfamily)